MQRSFISQRISLIFSHTAKKPSQHLRLEHKFHHPEPQQQQQYLYMPLRIQISVLIVPKLAAPIRNSVRTHIHTVPYLKSLSLAHAVTGDESFDISVLIGLTIIGSLQKTIQSRAMDQLQLSQSLATFSLAHSSYRSLQPQLAFMLQSSTAPATLHMITLGSGSQNPVQMRTCKIPFSSYT